MSLINSTAIPSGASAYEIEQSLRFNDADVTYLSRDTVSTAAGRKKFTISCWVLLYSPRRDNSQNTNCNLRVYSQRIQLH